MAGLLALFYYVVVPAVVVTFGVRFVVPLVSGSESAVKWIVAFLAGMLALLGLVWVLGGGKKLSVDDEVKKLCATDGGTRIFEQVPLPATEFDKYGTVKYWYGSNSTSSFDEKNAINKSVMPLGPHHIMETETRYLKQGEPSLTRIQDKILRSNDGKVMGERVYYFRRGGDLPGPWHPSSFGCPMDAPDLLKSVFVSHSSITANPSLQGTLRDESTQRP